MSAKKSNYNIDNVLGIRDDHGMYHRITGAVGVAYKTQWNCDSGLTLAEGKSAGESEVVRSIPGGG